MEFRLTNIKLYYDRPTINIARYMMIKHSDRFKNPRRGALLKQAPKRYQNDGIKNVNYTLTKIEKRKLFTHILIDVGSPPQYLMEILHPVSKPIIDEKQINKNNLITSIVTESVFIKENEIKNDFININ